MRVETPTYNRTCTSGSLHASELLCVFYVNVHTCKNECMARRVEQSTAASAQTLRSGAFVLRSSVVSCVWVAMYFDGDALHLTL